MIRSRWLYLLIVILLVGCGRLPGTRATAVPSPTIPAPTAIQPAPTDTLPPATDLPSPEPTEAEPPPTFTAVPQTAVDDAPLLEVDAPFVHTETAATELALRPENVYLYPVPTIYEGDLVTFQLIADVPPAIAADEVDVEISINEMQVVAGTLNWRNLGGEVTGLYEWVWNTTGLVGAHDVQITLDPGDRIQDGDANPDDNRVTLSVVVHPLTDLPPNEATAEWITTELGCCRVYVVAGTAAHRDLPQLLQAVQAAVQQASRRLGESPARKLDIFFISRVIGQGGYAGSSMVVSYLDRQYAGGGLYEVLVHEAVHLLDRQFAPNRIQFMAEGVAVWATGGHYKPEPIQERVAALVQLGLYVPLAQLIDSFYPTQHEIGYLEAAGLVGYLVDNYGWDRVRPFHVTVKADGDTPLSVIFDQQLQAHFGLTLAALEVDWLGYLGRIELQTAVVDDLRTSLRYYQVMRHYQQYHDPTAYFLRAWLPFPHEAMERGITADFTRHPNSELNVTLELMLTAANNALRAGEVSRANVLLDSVERVLATGGFRDPLSGSYLGIVRATRAEGYEPQQIDLEGDQAVVLATTAASVHTVRLRLVLRNESWLLAN